jgi:hypothetical protein
MRHVHIRHGHHRVMALCLDWRGLGRWLVRLCEESCRVIVEALLKCRKSGVILVLQASQIISSSTERRLTVEGAVLNSSKWPVWEVAGV